MITTQIECNDHSCAGGPGSICSGTDGVLAIFMPVIGFLKGMI